MTSKKPCINFPACSYTGKEQSPLRYGLSAEGYSINSVIEGYDKHMWVVEIKNGKKVWNRKDDLLCITHEEPVIKSFENNIVEQQAAFNNQPNDNQMIKKTTDYNIFLSYRLKQLKENNQKSDNKGYLNTVISEWKNIKNNPVELNRVLEEAKKYVLENPIKTKSKKNVVKKIENTVTKVKTSSESVLTIDTIVNDTIVNDTIVNDAIVNDTIVNDAIVNDTIVNDTIVNDTIVNDTIVNDTIVNDTIVNDAIVNDTIVNDNKTKKPRVTRKKNKDSDKLDNNDIDTEKISKTKKRTAKK
jgi:hypothetical protein